MPNEQADANVVVKPSESWLNQEEEVLKGVESVIGGEKLDAVLCVAGGWAGGNAASKGWQIFKNQKKRLGAMCLLLGSGIMHDKNFKVTCFGVIFIRDNV